MRQHGGTPSQTVTRQTKRVGELGWPLLDDGRPSNKLSRASTYGIPAVSERRFLEWIGKAIPDSLHRTYSASQIAALSKLSSGTVDELVRFGLLTPEAVCSDFVRPDHTADEQVEAVAELTQSALDTLILEWPTLTW